MSNSNSDKSKNSSNSSELIRLINTNIDKDATVYPFIDNLVDSLFTNNLNSLINNNTELHTDKSVFMMFVNIYFMAYLHTQDQTHINMTEEERKIVLKKMLSEVIRCPEKRQVCVSLIKQINPLFNIDAITQTIKNDIDEELKKDEGESSKFIKEN